MPRQGHFSLYYLSSSFPIYFTPLLFMLLLNKPKARDASPSFSAMDCLPILSTLRLIGPFLCQERVGQLPDLHLSNTTKDSCSFRSEGGGSCTSQPVEPPVLSASGTDVQWLWTAPVSSVVEKPVAFIDCKKRRWRFLCCRCSSLLSSWPQSGAAQI